MLCYYCGEERPVVTVLKVLEMVNVTVTTRVSGAVVIYGKSKLEVREVFFFLLVFYESILPSANFLLKSGELNEHFSVSLFFFFLGSKSHQNKKIQCYSIAVLAKYCIPDSFSYFKIPKP